MFKFKYDVTICLVLLILKYTIAPNIPIILAFLPIIIGFSWNFIMGIIDAFNKK